jgi:hypothetical protein
MLSRKCKRTTSLPQAETDSCALFLFGQGQAQEKKTNIVVIMTDDVGWGDLMYYMLPYYAGVYAYDAPHLNLVKTVTKDHVQKEIPHGRSASITLG